jgi:hypothetical protein
MPKIVADNIPKHIYEKLLKQKETDGFNDKTWRDWIISKSASALQVTDTEGLQRSTRGALRKMWGVNMGYNISLIHKQKIVKSLRDITNPEAESVLVVGGGPSIAIHNQLQTIKDSGYKGTIVSCDRMLVPLLKMGIVPNFVIGVDGSDIILKFYKNPLVKKHKDQIKFLIHLATHPEVVNYLYKIKADVYWFLAHQVFMNDEEVENSDAIALICTTITPHNLHAIQTLVCGGNVGVGAWAFSWSILHKKKVAFIGMDMGYPEGTPLEKTYYYSTFLNMTQERCGGKTTFASLAAQIPFEKEWNPIWKVFTYTDQVFRSYRKIFESYLEITPKDVEITSCVQCGALHHPRLKYSTLKDWLAKNT